ncbi:acyl-CoA synthetase [Fodinicurvata sp. EGI_FJ10296]|uniref:acyl-CoA synthetase n=1 Tax=Fodinicurvata sp. EGI_FJ10296 TaxID=3231908 RepID=UPI0034533BB6
MSEYAQDPISPFESGDLDRRSANFAPLTPLSFLKRTASVFPDRTAVIHGRLRRTWRQTHDRCLAVASALRGRGVDRGDVVAVMAPNIPELMEAHFAVPMAGAVLNALNTRSDSETVAYILDHSAARILIADREYEPVISNALSQMRGPAPLLVIIDDPEAELPPKDASGGIPNPGITYDDLVAEGDPAFEPTGPADEWEAIALNYTSGTTGNPKGVVYHHRGAYLTAVGNIMTWGMGHHPVYLWTLPMFHCNGWCFPWTITAMAGTHVCLRKVTGPAIYQAAAEHGVTHLCGAPIIMSMLVNADPAERRALPNRVAMMTAASAPPSAVLRAIDEIGIDVTHVYGLTEVYGPAVVCAWNEDWNALPADERAARRARQGVSYPVLDGLMVAEPDTMVPAPRDGVTIGEVFMRGNVVMKGYLKNPEATEKAFAGGWFHTGDLGVIHPDGYIELKDRSKDIIISGGENISTIEIEDVLFRHPGVLDAAVVAQPHDVWGETPCAFVTPRPGVALTEEEIIAFCRETMAHYKCPRAVVFCDLPKTSTGKIQKFALREKAKALAERESG